MRTYEVAQHEAPTKYYQYLSSGDHSRVAPPRVVRLRSHLPRCHHGLWPDMVRREIAFFIAVLVSCVLPPLVAFWKFSTFASYHTWGAKLAALVVGGSAIVLFAGGPPWLFHLAVPISVLAALEEMAITLVLPERQANVHSFWHVRKAHRHAESQ